MPKARFIRPAPRMSGAGSGHGSTLHSVRSRSGTLLTRIFSHRNCKRRARDCPHNRACPPPWPPAVPGNSYRGAVFRQILASFLYPREISCSSTRCRRRGRLSSRRARGKNFNFPEVEFPLDQAISPNEIAIAAIADADFRRRVAMPVPRVVLNLNSDLRGFYRTLFEISRGSPLGPGGRLSRSPAFVG